MAITISIPGLKRIEGPVWGLMIKQPKEQPSQAAQIRLQLDSAFKRTRPSIQIELQR